MARILTKDTVNKIGQEVILMGWVHSRRDHGKLIFIDLRDRWGLVQVVFSPKDGKHIEGAEKLRDEWVVKLTGLVKERPRGMENPEVPTGHIEIEATVLEILNEAKNPPFPLQTAGHEIEEELRLKYRYLDLRRAQLQKNFILRDAVSFFMRKFLHEKDFIEIETPILTKSTPEGARDYVVPSRLYPGKFFALPQSPQQYKQLLMVAGMERYFQLARCFRDEDTRGDRQPEFTQLDMEISFIGEEDVIALNEELAIELIKTVAPHKKIQAMPFPRLPYQEAIEKYGSDRPDLRTDKNDPDLLAFAWVLDFPFFEKDKEDKWTFTHNPFSAPKPEYLDSLLQKKNISEIKAAQYDLTLNGFEIAGGSIRNHRPEALDAVLEIIGIGKEEREKNFGHLLDALSFGAPPHGGIAWGLDRFVTLLAGEPNIREVIAFPKTGDARDPLMEAPAELAEKQLKELQIQVRKQ